MMRPPAEIGIPLEEVESPALILDLDTFERNLKRLADAGRRLGVRLRPHAKTHKCPVIARRQMALGAVGVCCQTVGEAEAMVFGGIDDVLVTNEVVDRVKVNRLVSLAKQARVAVCADDAGNAEALNAAAAAFGARLDVLVEVNVGANRCGVEPGRPALVLAEAIAALPNLNFAGLQAYHGAAQHIRDFTERRSAALSAAKKAGATKALIEGAGLPCERVTGAGTGTYRFEPESGVYDEIQAGSYVFMDADYGHNLDEGGGAVSEFEQSLHILATVVSRPDRARCIVNAGLKALSVDSGMPVVDGDEGARYVGASDEHGKIEFAESRRGFDPGERVRLVPGHCDPTVNLHDWIVGYRGNHVEALWPVAARGAF
ncbi:MAG: DSD1 family PLP-dependent enzyme [Rhodospirillales bacterium]|jgi:D-serine deaminase-like pyridoxal phosphate-dependent protein|nr:DSD1 family PLP-dependent enzyme [Rhodospirillales bacterium]